MSRIESFEVCDCSCHKPGASAIHVRPCCEPCPYCHGNIKPECVKQHEFNCPNRPESARDLNGDGVIGVQS